MLTSHAYNIHLIFSTLYTTLRINWKYVFFLSFDYIHAKLTFAGSELVSSNYTSR